MKKIILALILVILVGFLSLSSIFLSPLSHQTVFAQTGVTPTLYCLSPNCPNPSTTTSPQPSSVTTNTSITTSILPSTNTKTVTPCSNNSLQAPAQNQSNTTTVKERGGGHHEGGFLFKFFEFLLLILDLILKVGGGSGLPCSPTPTVSVPSTVPSPSVIASVSAAPVVSSTVPTAITGTVTGTQPGGSGTPNQILDFKNWYLTLPIGAPTTISSAQLTGGYQDQYFHTDSAKAVTFYAPVTGATTTNSDHTRSELRETDANGKIPWGWDAGVGTHTMTATEAITHLPGGPGKSGRVGFAQIHGDSGTWYLILEADDNNNGTATLKVHDQTNKVNGAVIDSKYVLGTKFDLVFSAINGTVTVTYNGAQKLSTTSTLTNAYFKIGAYNQSAGDYSEVKVYSLKVQHN